MMAHVAKARQKGRVASGVYLRVLCADEQQFKRHKSIQSDREGAAKARFRKFLTCSDTYHESRSVMMQLVVFMPISCNNLLERALTIAKSFKHS